MKILEVMTEHTTPFKVLIEVLKEILQETNMEFRCDVIDKNNDSKEKSEVDASETEDNDENSDDDTKKEDKSGLKIMAVDTTKTVLINLRLDAKNFTKFRCRKKKLTLGVNLVYFHKLIKSMDKDDNLTLYVDNDDKNYLKIKIDNPEQKKATNYKLKLLDLGNQPMHVPDITFDAVVIMNASEFHKICREMSQIAEYVEIKCLKNKIIFTCKGDYAERCTTYRTGEGDEGDGITIKLASDNTKKSTPLIIQGIYELRNLVLFSKCSSLCNDIEIYMKNNYPLVIKYTVATLGRILLCLTPINDETTKNDNFSDDDEYYSDGDVNVIL